ncbi:MAG: hypothetical protein FWH27_05195 [Planctomycetaceae bacterium]|nr:hypothetical protein [Planctomycetaceae bacterium]
MFQIRAARVIERSKRSRMQNVSNQSRDGNGAVEAEQSSKRKVQSEDKEAEHSAFCILHSAFCILHSAFAKMTETDV